MTLATSAVTSGSYFLKFSLNIPTSLVAVSSYLVLSAQVLRGLRTSAGTPSADPSHAIACEAASCAVTTGALIVGAICRAGALCEAYTPTPSPKVTPTATATPGANDCCQCASFCAEPVVGTCGGCAVVHGASCVEGTLCVSRTPPVPCAGDCNGTGEVTVDGLITLVNIALGNLGPESCPQGNPGGGVVTIDILIKAVNNALWGCPQE